jgi:hypothetical protein
LRADATVIDARADGPAIQGLGAKAVVRGELGRALARDTLACRADARDTLIVAGDPIEIGVDALIRLDGAADASLAGIGRRRAVAVAGGLPVQREYEDRNQSHPEEME